MKPTEIIQRKPQQVGISHPIQNHFDVNLREIHIPGTIINFHKASPLHSNDPTSDIMVQRINDSGNRIDLPWRDFWNRIQELPNLSIQGLLKYYTWHFVKESDGNGYDIMMVTEFANASLQTIQSSSSSLELQDLIRMMIQVNTTLCDLEKFGHSHQSINPEMILVRRTDEGAVHYKLAASISSIPVSGKKYEERTEYLPYIAPDRSSHQNDIKNDVYSLGMTFLDVAGVSKDTLMKIRSGDVNNSQHDNSVLGELIQLVLQAVDQNYAQRLNPKEFGERLALLLSRANDCHDFTMKSFVKRFEETLKLLHTSTNHQILVTENQELIQLPTHGKDEGVPPLPQVNVRTGGRENQQKTRGKCRKLCSRIKSAVTLETALFIVGTILSLLTLAIGITVLVKARVLADYGSFSSAMDSIYENLNTVPFSSVTVVEGACPSGYTSISELGNWGGTTSFCYDEGRIDTDTDEEDCENYYPFQASQSYSSWKNLSLCAQPVAGFSNSSQCSASQTSCYTGVCVTGTQCPITELQFSASALSSDGWTSVQYNSSFYINYRQDPGTLPLATFRINIGEAKSCLSSQEYSLQKDYPANSENVINGMGCTKYGSFPNSKAIDTENALETFYAQSWSSEVLKLPEYAELLNSQISYLTASPRIELSAACSSMSFDSLTEGASKLRIIFILTRVFGILTLIMICLMSIIPCLSETIVGGSDSSFKPRHRLTFGGFDDEEKAVATCCCSSLIIVVLILATALTGWKFSDFEPYYDDYEFITQNSCFIDGTVQSTIQKLVDSVDAARTIYHLWIGLVVSFGVLFIVLIYLCFLKCREYSSGGGKTAEKSKPKHLIIVGAS